MGMMTSSTNDLEKQYDTWLQEFLLKGGEAYLQKAYELGRQAVTDGLGVLDMAAIHHRALITILARSGPTSTNLEEVKRSGEFFAEGMSRFEMTHPAFREAN